MHIGTGQIYDPSAPKSRINMTLNEDLVRVARGYTDNLSDYVEKLLAAAIAEERRKRLADQEHWDRVCASWAEFHEKHGCVADEYNADFRPGDATPLMPQFDVHRNPGRSREATPYLLVIQRDRYDRMPRRVVVPLVRREYTGHTDRDLNPGFTVEGLDVVMDPLALASVPVRDLGSAIASLDHDSTRIIRAIDELVAYGR